VKLELEAVDRPSIRSIVEQHFAELRAMAESDGNYHQRSLDQQDEVEELVRSLSPDQQLRFLRIYEEECEAQRAVTDARVEELRSQRVRDEERIRQMHESDTQLGHSIAGMMLLVIIAVVAFLFLHNAS